VIELPWPPSNNSNVVAFDQESMAEIPDIQGIYSILDAKSGAFYVGSAVSLRKRMNDHLYRLARGSHANQRLQRIWAKRPESLRFLVIETLPGADRSARLAREQAYLDESRVGENVNCINVLGVAGSHEGRKRTAETIEKLRAANVGRTFTAESREKMRMAKLGVPRTAEARAILSAARKGRPCNRPLGIINQSLRKLTAEKLAVLKEMRAGGASWSELAVFCGLDRSACRRAVLGITYKDLSR
jgi:group I intron endonuclease